jgi:hypothetical protein
LIPPIEDRHQERTPTVRPLTRQETRDAFRNTTAHERKVLRLPGAFDSLAWDRLDYLGWRDPRSPLRAYLVALVDDEPHGVLLRQSATRNELANRAVMCALCRFTRRFNEVALFSAARPGDDRRGSLDTLGIYVCTDLDCHTSVHSTPLPGPLDPPAEEIVRARRDGLRARTGAFVRSVVMQ